MIIALKKIKEKIKKIKKLYFLLLLLIKALLKNLIQSIKNYFKNSNSSQVINVSTKIIIILIFINIAFNLIIKCYNNISNGKNSDPYNIMSELKTQDYITSLTIEGPLFSRFQIGEIFSKENLEKINKSNNKALILKINSPGGTTEVINIARNFIQKIKHNKPVICLIASKKTDEVAISASAAYWISSFCEKIYSHSEFDVIGSIGGYMQPIFSIKNILSSIGIKFGNISSNNNLISKDFHLNGLVNKEGMQSALNTLLSQFYEDVSISRKLNKKEQNLVFNGKIFTAKQALQLKLIDGILYDYESLIQQNKDMNQNPMMIYLFSKYKIPINTKIKSLDNDKSKKKLTHGSKRANIIKQFNFLSPNNHALLIADVKDFI